MWLAAFLIKQRIPEQQPIFGQLRGLQQGGTAPTAFSVVINIPIIMPVTTLKLTTIGTSTGVILPKQLLALLRVKKGDQLYAVETPNGVLLTPYDPEIQNQLEIGERLLEKHRDIFKALAE